MAEPVNNQLLSAVTEGHRSSSTGSSADLQQNIGSSSTSYINPGRNPGLKLNNNRRKVRDNNEQSRQQTVEKTKTSLSPSRAETAAKRRHQSKVDSESFINSRSSKNLSKQQGSSPTTRRVDRKRTSDQIPAASCEDLLAHSSQKKRRHNSSAKESNSSPGRDCVALRTRSRTLGDIVTPPVLRQTSIKSSLRSERIPKQNIVTASTTTGAVKHAINEEVPNQIYKKVSEPLDQQPLNQYTAQTKSNLLSYFRKTRGSNSNSTKKSVSTELLDHNYQSTNRFDNTRESDSAPQVVPEYSIVANNSGPNRSESKLPLRLTTKKSVSSAGKLKSSSKERKNISSNVDKNRKVPQNTCNRPSSSSIRNLRSTISESGNNSHSQRQPISCSSSDNFTAPQQQQLTAAAANFGGYPINPSTSYSITFNHGGAVPKKRQKVGDYSEYLYSTSTTAAGTLISGAGSVGSVHSGFGSSVIGAVSGSASAAAGTSSAASGISVGSHNLVPISLQASSSIGATTGYNRTPNLGARLARGGGGATRDATQQQQPHPQHHSSLQAIINQNYQSGLGGAIGDSSLQALNQQSSGSQIGGALSSSSSSHILRRSSRGKTGSCVSSSAAAQGSGSGVAASSSSLSAAAALAGTSAPGSTASRAASHHYNSTHHSSHRATSASAVSSAHCSLGKGSGSSRGSAVGKQYDFGGAGVGGPSTSTPGSVMANDGNRPSSGGNSKLLKPKLLKQKLVNNHQTAHSSISGGLDAATGTNLNLMGQQSSGVANGNAAGGGGGAGAQPSQAAGSSASNAATNAAHPDSESDDSEVGRLQALLEARGLPPHLFGALGPRMTHILHRTIGASSSSKAQQLLQGLQSHDESQQLQAAIEMCQMLVMGNEDTLAGFPIKQVVPALISLLRMEHNFDIMNNACRALAYMLEALPRSSGTVVDAIPVFLEKLQVIQCMDVAEQSLTALEILSRRHNKAILQANGVSACLTYLDFFSINAQRAALAITANCCLNLHPEEFHFVSKSLPLLAPLLAQQDKKCVESVCTAFYRLVESFQHDQPKLQEIASKELLKNCQQLLVLTPSVLNTGTFTNVVRMLGVMCASSPDLAISLLKNDIASTLLYLLTGSAEPSQTTDVELMSRSPSELYEITCLIGELMPRLPIDGIFSVDALLERPNAGVQDQVQWQWRDDRGVWHSYSAIDSRMIEAAHMNSDDEISLSTLGRTYTVDFHSMQQINEDTGTTRAVQRKVNTNYVSGSSAGQDLSSAGPSMQSQHDYESRIAQRDARIACLREERGLASEFIKNLFSVLYEVYSSSAGPAVRYKCLRALLRMVYYASADLLREVLKNQIVSSHIAGMMASNDLRIVVGALQMAEILMQKLPEVFGTHFRREGVIHQINQLADPNNPICANPSPKPAGAASGALSAPPSATGFQMNPFDFDTSTPTKVEHGNSHVKNLSHAMNVLNSKMSVSMPSTSGATLQIPAANSSTLAISLAGPPPMMDPLTMASSLPNNGNFVMYSTSAPIDPRQYSYHPPPHYQTHMDMMSTSAQSSSAPDTASAAAYAIPSPSSTIAIQNKMSDILKRRIPPKRKSQSSNRSKSRQEDSVVQDLINRATTIGSSSSGRNTPSSSGSSSRPRGVLNSTGGSSGGSGGGSSSKTSFLASLNPARWGRQGSHSSFAKDSSSTNASNIGKSASNANLIAAGNREKARQWIRDQAISFINRYTEQEIAKSIHPAASVLSRLAGVIYKLDGSAVDCLESLVELKNILIESDISPFEVNHSGLIKAMLTFMSSDQGIVPRDNRLRYFLHVFAGLPKDSVICGGGMPTIKSAPFSAFVAKLNGCVTQLEQFPVRVHDFPAGPGGRSNTSALKFFNTHQLKCNLQRHPDCSNLRQWKGGTVKIDPLALVQAIERYLVVRGYGGIRGDSEDDSEEDMDDNVAAVAMSQSGLKHRLQFLIGDHVLPYNMTVYQAVKQYSPAVNDQSETDTESETPIGNASIWVQQHTIYYRPIEEEQAVSGNSSKGTSSSKKSSKSSSSKLMRKKTEFWLEGVVPSLTTPHTLFLTNSLPADIVTVQDASLDALCMLRIINALNRHWESLYTCTQHENLISQSEFVHSKITAKANRQLQDPLVIMTGNLPQWLQQIALACPFLFPFETRHLLFYAISFDRDRALQRLLDTAPDLNSSDTTERVTPRLDRRKRAISREDILKQAEHIIQDFGHSKALLEIQYENEVGTGLGPTLEFYALVSGELQRCDLGLWNGSDSYKQNSSTIVDVVKSGLAQIDDGNESGGGNNGVVGTGQGGGVGGNNRYNTGTLAATNNALNQSIDSGSYIAYENTVNMIIEQQVDVHMSSHGTETTQTVSSHNTRSLVIENEANRDHHYQMSQSNHINRTSHDNVQHIRNAPATLAPVVRSVTVTHVNAPHGLFPLPLGKAAKLSQISRVKSKFKFLGKFIAKAVMDSRMLDLPFSIPFYRWMLCEESSLSLADLAWVAPEVQSTLVRLQEVVRQRDVIQLDSSVDAMEKTEKIEQLDLDGCPIADLGLDFVLPGHANIELRRGGRDIPVTIHNLHQYISLVTHWFLFEGVQRQFEAIREGFDSVFQSNRLRMFYPEELESVFCGTGATNYQRWDTRMLQEYCRTDHGFTQDSQAIRYLYDILSTYNRDEQRLFLQFVTGSPRLPTGGFKALTPPLTIVRKTLDPNQNPDDYLPSVMTCVNYLKLPEYSSREVMRAKLKVAVSEGSMSFHLS